MNGSLLVERLRRIVERQEAPAAATAATTQPPSAAEVVAPPAPPPPEVEAEPASAPFPKGAEALMCSLEYIDQMIQLMGVTHPQSEKAFDKFGIAVIDAVAAVAKDHGHLEAFEEAFTRVQNDMSAAYDMASQGLDLVGARKKMR